MQTIINFFSARDHGNRAAARVRGGRRALMARKVEQSSEGDSQRLPDRRPVVREGLVRREEGDNGGQGRREEGDSGGQGRRDEKESEPSRMGSVTTSLRNPISQTSLIFPQEDLTPLTSNSLSTGSNGSNSGILAVTPGVARHGVLDQYYSRDHARDHVRQMVSSPEGRERNDQDLPAEYSLLNTHKQMQTSPKPRYKHVT